MSENNKNHYDVIIVGGGASGLMAACSASKSNMKILVLEKNTVVGKKLSITGGGRCNITNNIPDPKEFLEHFPQSKQFLYSAFSEFSMTDTEKFFTEHKLPLITQARNRMFPITESSPDVTNTLKRLCVKQGVVIQTNMPVTKITSHDNFWKVRTSQGFYICGKLILSTGGYAAPETGSTGDGFKWLTSLGHTVSKPSPNLVPLKTDAVWVHALAGVSIDYAKVRFYADQDNTMKQQINKTGRILFTHFGISGPLVLNTSYEVSQLLAWHNKVECSLDLFPDNDHGQLDKKLIKILNNSPKKKIFNALPKLVPKQLALTILTSAEVPHETFCGELSKTNRKMIINTCKDLRFPITGTTGYDRAVIADGGVDPREVNFKTMQSKKHQNLYLTGDLLDINRPSGGFSLQLCWTTGYIAGSHASRSGV